MANVGNDVLMSALAKIEILAKLQAARKNTAVEPVVEPVWEERVAHSPFYANHDSREVLQRNYGESYFADNNAYCPDNYYHPESYYQDPVNPPQSSFGYEWNGDYLGEPVEPCLIENPEAWDEYIRGRNAELEKEEPSFQRLQELSQRYDDSCRPTCAPCEPLSVDTIPWSQPAQQTLSDFTGYYGHMDAPNAPSLGEIWTESEYQMNADWDRERSEHQELNQCWEDGFRPTLVPSGHFSAETTPWWSQPTQETFPNPAGYYDFVEDSRPNFVPSGPFSAAIAPQWRHQEQQTPSHPTLELALESTVERTQQSLRELSQRIESMNITMAQLASTLEEQNTPVQLPANTEVHAEEPRSTDTMHEEQLSTEVAPQETKPTEGDCRELEEEEVLRGEIKEELKYERVTEGIITYEVGSSSHNPEPSHLTNYPEHINGSYFNIPDKEQCDDPQPVDVFEREGQLEDSSRPITLYEDHNSAEAEDVYVKIFPDEQLHRLGEPAVARYGGRGLFEAHRDKYAQFLEDGRLLQFDEWPIQWECVT